MVRLGRDSPHQVQFIMHHVFCFTAIALSLTYATDFKIFSQKIRNSDKILFDDPMKRLLLLFCCNENDDWNINAFYEYQFNAAATRPDKRIFICLKWTHILLDLFCIPSADATHFLVQSFYIERLSCLITATSPNNDFLGRADCRTRSLERHLDVQNY